MKETIRTASVLEIYNEAIKANTIEKRNLEKRLIMLKSGSFAREIGMILGYVIIFSFFLVGVDGAVDTHSSKQGIFFLILIISIFSGLFYSRKIERSTTVKNTEIKHISERIEVLNREIEGREARKKSLLEAEEVIVAKDINSVKGKIETEKFTEIIPEPDTKICPMCAEIVKTAAKICRYCSHKFE